VVEDLCSQRELVKAGELDKAERFPMRSNPFDDECDVVLEVDTRWRMLPQMNVRETDNGLTSLPCMFGEYPMFDVVECRLSECRHGPPATSISKAMQELFDCDKILQRFEWNGSEWQKQYATCHQTAVNCRAVYELASAIIRTKCGETDEYLFVHWPISGIDRPFVKGKRWVDAFNTSGGRLDLGEVCAIFYERVTIQSEDE
jgi:hypothetical protein